MMKRKAPEDKYNARLACYRLMKRKYPKNYWQGISARRLMIDALHAIGHVG
jgi:hypothetical protein